MFARLVSERPANEKAPFFKLSTSLGLRRRIYIALVYSKS